MKKLTGDQRRRDLKTIAALSEDQIDTSDIPELTEELLRSGTRGQMYRPIKKPVTMRLDADVLEWLKRDGAGYQTRANALLRREMVRTTQEKKGPESADRMNGARNKTTMPKR